MKQALLDMGFFIWIPLDATKSPAIAGLRVFVTS